MGAGAWRLCVGVGLLPHVRVGGLSVAGCILTHRRETEHAGIRWRVWAVPGADAAGHARAQTGAGGGVQPRGRHRARRHGEVADGGLWRHHATSPVNGA